MGAAEEGGGKEMGDGDGDGGEYLISMYRGKSVIRSFLKAIELPATSSTRLDQGPKNGIRGEWEAGIVELSVLVPMLANAKLWS